jgi:hypothetical protein
LSKQLNYYFQFLLLISRDSNFLISLFSKNEFQSILFEFNPKGSPPIYFRDVNYFNFL